jgi:23S rRNA pseudouridine2605 synthase
MPAERLQKIIAAAGLASRRKAEELITAGRVQVNGKTVKELGSKADPEHDHIRVDGKLLHGPERPIYLMLNKPKGYITAASDPQGRPTVLDLVRAGARVYPVGRLDYASEGLLLLTNDGALAAKLMHASSHVPKTYQVKVSGRPTEAELGKLRAGVVLPPDPKHPRAPRKESRKTAPAGIRLLRDAPNPWYEVTLIEGQNRQIRRMFETVGHHVEKIKRVRYGPLELDIEPGASRPLSPRELARLRAAISQKRDVPPARRRDTKELS